VSIFHGIVPCSYDTTSGRRCRRFDREPVEPGLHIGRQPGAQCLVVQIGMKVGQDRPGRLNPFDPRQCIVDAEMARMRLISERIHDPDIDPCQGSYAGLGQAAQVTGIGQGAEPEAQGRNIPVLLEDGEDHDRTALPVDGDRLAGLEPMLGHDRGVFTAGRRLEAIAEAGTQ
jgi:hypothetical protein